jgi:hypothetical protein
MAQLQTRIASMQSQLLIGGHKVEDSPQFRWAWGWGLGRAQACRFGGICDVWGWQAVQSQWQAMQPQAGCSNTLLTLLTSRTWRKLR